MTGGNVKLLGRLVFLAAMLMLMLVLAGCWGGG